MSSTRNAVGVVPSIGYGVGSVLAMGLLSGLVLHHQLVWSVWAPLAVTAAVVYLFYRMARNVTRHVHPA